MPDSASPSGELTGDELGAVTNFVNVTMQATLPAPRAMIAGTTDLNGALAMI